MTGKTPRKPGLFRPLAKLPLRKDLFIVIIVSYVLAYLIIVFSIQQNLPQYGFNIRNFRLNEPAPEDFIVQRENISYIDENATRERKEASIKLVTPVFKFDRPNTVISLKKFDDFFAFFNDGHESSLEILQTNLQYNFPDIMNFFGENEIAAIMELFPDHTEVFQSTQKLLTDLLEEHGLFGDMDELSAEHENLFTAGKIELVRDRYYKEEIQLNSIIQSSNLQQWIDDRIKTMPMDEVKKSLVRLFLTAFAQENCFFDKVETQSKQDLASTQVPPVIKQLAKGKVIVRKNEIVTEEAMVQIEAHGESDISLNINLYLQTGLYLLMLYALIFFLFSRRNIFMKLKKLHSYLIIITGLFFLLLASLLNLVPWQSDWVPFTVLLPINTLTIIITIIISSSVGVTFSLLCALLVLIVTNFDMNAFLFTFLTGIGGCFVALRAEKRLDLIKSAFMLAILSFLILIMLGFINNFQIQDSLAALGWSIINGFIYGVLSFSLLPAFEYLLNAATRFRLMELSDLNSPIFKKMLTLAPGTYNHSVFIANLAESVCEEIGANPLLARVGAYYHDIGKVDQAEYFIENQRDANKHDELKPTLSAAIIKSHVKIGIEKAKELRLPNDVVDIIAQHHGKGVISYFYQRAISESKNMKVPPSDFSYTTPRPRTKEAAVVMLADVVEAASRTLRKPTMVKLEKFIWNIILDKFNAGELSDSNLTLNDLEIIKNKFVQLMAGHFHSRIEYPKVKEGQK